MSLLAGLNPIGLIANVATGIGNFLQQGKTNQANEDMVNNQMNFQREMSNTEVTRRIADLRRNNLNPYLAATEGASAPSGASTNLQAPQINMPDMMAYGISLKQLELQQQQNEVSKGKLALDVLNSKTDRTYKEWKTFNEQYSLNNAIARFFKSMYNEKGTSLSPNDIFDAFKKFNDKAKKDVYTPNNQLNDPEFNSLEMRGY